MRHLVLVRHGETLGESSIRLNGATDVSLSPLGFLQMARAGTALATEPFDAVIASPLRRSREGAERVRPGASIRVVGAFREVDFGRWETWTWEEVGARDPAGLAAFRAAGSDAAYPGGESRAAFRARVVAAADELTRGRTLAVLHKGVIKVVIGALTGLGPDEAAALPCDLGGISRLTERGGRWRLDAVNALGHLERDHSAPRRR